jgi:dynein heavy chain
MSVVWTQASDVHCGRQMHADVVRHACQDVPKKVSSAEVGGNALRQLMTMSKDVYFPLLTNPGNQKGWPEVIVKEFTENLHRFMAQTFVTMGHMNGETLLPLPPDDVYTNMEKNQQDKESIHVLETAVIAWTRQIKDILRQVSSAFVRGHCSRPRVR